MVFSSVVSAERISHSSYVSLNSSFFFLLLSMREYFTLYTTDQFHILRTVLDTFYKVPTRRIVCHNQELLQLVIISFTLTHNRTNAAKALAHKNLTEKGHHNEKWRFIQVETRPMPPDPTPRTRLYTFKRIESDSIQSGLNIHILFVFDVFDFPNTLSVANVTPWRCFTSVLVPEKLNMFVTSVKRLFQV